MSMRQFYAQHKPPLSDFLHVLLAPRCWRVVVAVCWRNRTALEEFLCARNSWHSWTGTASPEEAMARFICLWLLSCAVCEGIRLTWFGFQLLAPFSLHRSLGKGPPVSHLLLEPTKFMHALLQLVKPSNSLLCLSALELGWVCLTTGSYQCGWLFASIQMLFCLLTKQCKCSFCHEFQSFQIFFWCTRFFCALVFFFLWYVMRQWSYFHHHQHISLSHHQPQCKMMTDLDSWWVDGSLPRNYLISTIVFFSLPSLFMPFALLV